MNLTKKRKEKVSIFFTYKEEYDITNHISPFEKKCHNYDGIFLETKQTEEFCYCSFHAKTPKSASFNEYEQLYIVEVLLQCKKTTYILYGLFLFHDIVTKSHDLETRINYY